MKIQIIKQLAAVALVAVVSTGVVRAQGTIQFDNFGGGVDAPILAVNGTAIESGPYLAGLWIAGAPSQPEGSLVFSGLTTSFVGFGGYFLAGAQTLVGYAAGSQVTIQIRAWDTNTGVTYDVALDKGFSNLINVTLGGSGSPPTTPGLLAGLQGFQLTTIPEPTSMALAGLGIAGLLAFRRRN